MDQPNQISPAILGNATDVLEFLFRYQGLVQFNECQCCGRRRLVMIVRREGREEELSWVFNDEFHAEGKDEMMAAFMGAAQALDHLMGS